MHFKSGEYKKFLQEAKFVKSLLERDVALLDAFLDFNKKVDQVVLIDPFIQNALKIYTPAYIFVTKKLVPHKFEHSSTRLSQSSKAEFIINKMIRLEGQKTYIEGRFHIDDAYTNIFKIVKSNVDLIHSYSTGPEVYPVLKGENFSLNIRLKRTKFPEFLLHKERHILVNSLLLLCLFNLAFIYFARQERAFAKAAEKQYENQLQMYLQSQAMLEGAACSLRAGELEVTKIIQEFSNTVKRAIFGFKMLSAVNYTEAAEKIFATLSRLDIDHLNDPIEIVEVDLISIVERVINLNAYLIKQNHISIIKDVPATHSLVMCNESVLIKAAASLLYWAIIAAGPSSKTICIHIKEVDHRFILEIHDRGYRVFPDKEYCSPFKVPIEELKALLPRYGITLDVKNNIDGSTICAVSIPASNTNIKHHDNIVFLRDFR